MGAPARDDLRVGRGQKGEFFGNQGRGKEERKTGGEGGEKGSTGERGIFFPQLKTGAEARDKIRPEYNIGDGFKTLQGGKTRTVQEKSSREEEKGANKGIRKTQNGRNEGSRTQK